MSAENVGADSKAVLLLCSTLALARSASAPKPLSRSEWNDLARAIAASALQSPAALFGQSSEALQQTLGIAPALADRVTALLDRGGQLSIELERLQSIGIWVLTRADPAYPSLLRERLKGQAPPVLFGAGPRAPLGQQGVAIVGSRNVDEEGAAFAAALGERCAGAGLVVFSGGARGVDRLAVDGALAAGGHGVAVLADSLEEAIKRRETREPVVAGRLTVVTPSHPSARFSVAAAMGRNKLIYALASWAVVVASDLDSGGTWAGAAENLDAGWVPLFVRDGAGVPEGNRALLTRGATPIRLHDLPSDLASWFASQWPSAQPALVRESAQPGLFDSDP